MESGTYVIVRPAHPLLISPIKFLIPISHRITRNSFANLQKDFIWGGHKPKIKHATLIADYKDGGLKDVDIDSKFESLKFMWIQKLKDGSNHHPWKALPQKILGKCDSDYICHSNLKLSKSSVKAVRELPSLYRELLLLWEKISGCSKLNNRGILSQYL